jgi:2-succinyl-6-hydroxy-2,4-cyclohexadiene-1-carboxylate synthase
VLYDQRGHGGSSKLGREDGYDLEHLVGDLERFLDAIGVEQCDLLGHSLGGAVALRYVLAHPDRVTSLVLMDTAAGAPGQLRPELTASAAAVREFGIGVLVEQVVSAPLTGEDAVIAGLCGEAEHRRRMRAQLGAVDQAAFVALVPSLLDQPSIVDRLDEITCPTTVLVGSEDEPFLAPSRELAAGIAGATLVVLPGGGHSPQKSSPAAWLNAISCHLDGVRQD